MNEGLERDESMKTYGIGISFWKRNAFAFAALTTFVSQSVNVQGQTVDLGQASGFTVLGAASVTNTGPTVIEGNLGLSPGTSITGFSAGNGTVSGTTEINTAAANGAQADANAAFDFLAALPFTQDLSGQDLGGLILTPGIYRFSSSAQLTGLLTLNSLGLDNPLFVFQIVSALTTSAGSTAEINWINGESNNLYWQVGTSATLGTGAEFAGTIIALESITLGTGASLDQGRAIALTGTVALDSNLIIGVPEPASSVLVLSGVAFFLIFRSRRKGAI